MTLVLFLLRAQLPVNCERHCQRRPLDANCHIGVLHAGVCGWGLNPKEKAGGPMIVEDRFRERERRLLAPRKNHSGDIGVLSLDQLSV